MSALTVSQGAAATWLHGLRWLPVGLLIPVMILLGLDRGLTLSQLGLVAAAQGFVVFGLELPTGGLADAIGRRRVLLSRWSSSPRWRCFAVADSFARSSSSSPCRASTARWTAGRWRRGTSTPPWPPTPRPDRTGPPASGTARRGDRRRGPRERRAGRPRPVCPVSALTVPVLSPSRCRWSALVALLVLLVECRRPRGLRGLPGRCASTAGDRQASACCAAHGCCWPWSRSSCSGASAWSPSRACCRSGWSRSSAAPNGPRRCPARPLGAWLASAAGAASPRCCAPARRRPDRRADAGRAGPPWSGWACSPARSACSSRTSPATPCTAPRTRAHDAAAPPGRGPVPDQRGLAELDGGANRPGRSA